LSAIINVKIDANVVRQFIDSMTSEIVQWALLHEVAEACAWALDEDDEDEGDKVASHSLYELIASDDGLWLALNGERHKAVIAVSNQGIGGEAAKEVWLTLRHGP